ncbi:MAG: hypothetical protein RLN60_02040 [Phycisphaerales bacterium]
MNRVKVAQPLRADVVEHPIEMALNGPHMPWVTASVTEIIQILFEVVGEGMSAVLCETISCRVDDPFTS